MFGRRGNLMGRTMINADVPRIDSEDRLGAGAGGGGGKVKLEPGANLIDRGSSNKTMSPLNGGGVGGFGRSGGMGSEVAGGVGSEKATFEWGHEDRRQQGGPREAGGVRSPLGRMKEESSTENIDAETSSLSRGEALARLKRKIRLKLLADEARNAYAKQLAAAQDKGGQNVNVQRRKLQCSNVVTFGEEDGRAPRIAENAFQKIAEASLQQQQQQQPLQQRRRLKSRQQSPFVQERGSAALAGPMVRVQGQAVVDVSSESDADEANVSHLTVQQNAYLREEQASHLTVQQQHPPLPQRNHAYRAGKHAVYPTTTHQEQEMFYQTQKQQSVHPAQMQRQQPITHRQQEITYQTPMQQEIMYPSPMQQPPDVIRTQKQEMHPLQMLTAPLGLFQSNEDLEKLLTPIVNSIVQKGDKNNLDALAAPRVRKKPGPKPGSKRITKNKLGNCAAATAAVASLLTLEGQNCSTAAAGAPFGTSNIAQVSVGAGAGEIARGGAGLQSYIQPVKRVKQTKVSKGKDVALQDVATEYEKERDANIRRNKAFLMMLDLNTPLEPAKGMCTYGPHSQGEPATEEKTELMTQYHEPNEILQVNKDLEHLERSQITSTRSGSSASIERIDKGAGVLPTSDDEAEEAEDHPIETFAPIQRRKPGRPCLQRAKEQPGPREISKDIMSGVASVPGAPEGLTPEIFKFVSDYIASQCKGSLQPMLLKSEGGGDAVPKIKKKRGRKKASETVPTRTPSASAMTPLSSKKSSPAKRGGRGRKRKETWLTTIPFESPKTEYEVERDDIRQTQTDEFKRLGIVSELIEKPPPLPRQVRTYCKRWTAGPNPAYHRQTRLRDRLSNEGSVEETKKEICLHPPLESAMLTPTLIYDISKERKVQERYYTTYCERVESPALKGSQIRGFQQPQEGKELYVDPLLTRMYTIDMGLITGRTTNGYQKISGLLAAGGSQGRISIFAVPSAEDRLKGETVHDKEEDGGIVRSDSLSETKGPLLTWSVDTHWISQVLFWSDQYQEDDGLLLLSSSGNGRVVLWDINQMRISDGHRDLSTMGMPHVVCQTSRLHPGGISAMHELWGRLATCSENSVGISVIRDSMILMERSVDGFHTGDIRSVRIRDRNVVADCGADKMINIMDIRSREPSVCRMATAHKSIMSMIEWCPGAENILLSASVDPQIYLHDIRNPGALFLQAMEGHVHPRRAKCYSVYRPTFVGNGQAVVTPGEGTNQLSLYSVATGCEISKVHIGCDATILHWNGLLPDQEGGLWAGGYGITQFSPVWENPNDDDPEKPRPYMYGGPPPPLPPPSLQDLGR